jgi:hypothetical protein
LMLLAASAVAGIISMASSQISDTGPGILLYADTP